MKLARTETAIILTLAVVFLSTGPLFAAGPWEEPLEKVYWGDLHVHTNFSADAWILSMAPGNYVEEAGMFAAHCAKIDFYAVTDHSAALTSGSYWEEAIRAAQSYNRYGKENPGPEGDPSIVVFLGWEWTQAVPWAIRT